ncbi:hypothetical protein HDU85_002756 [Gaertneriomyces sp. JEL0708]|nr:hypothetical protein HDU85_002756 [Gaertneriomyces sp. JEL0708]
MEYATVDNARKDLQFLLGSMIKQNQTARKKLAAQICERAQDALNHVYEQDTEWIDYWTCRTERAKRKRLGAEYLEVSGSDVLGHVQDEVAKKAKRRKSDESAPSVGSASSSEVATPVQGPRLSSLTAPDNLNHDEHNDENGPLDELLKATIDVDDLLARIGCVVGRDEPAATINFSPESEDYALLPVDLANEYEDVMDKKFPLPPEWHEWLAMFFSDTLSVAEWQRKLDNITFSDPALAPLLRVVTASLPKFLQVLELDHLAPLADKDTPEHLHLNSFVHPVIEAATWHLAKVHYMHGEIVLKRHGLPTRQKADGLGITNTSDGFAVVYLEGAKPAADVKKITRDHLKILQNLKRMHARIVVQQVRNPAGYPQIWPFFPDKRLSGTCDYQPSRIQKLFFCMKWTASRYHGH